MCTLGDAADVNQVPATRVATRSTVVPTYDVIGCFEADKQDGLTFRLRRGNLNVISHMILALSQFRSSKYTVLQENDHHSKSYHRFPKAVNIFYFECILLTGVISIHKWWSSDTLLLSENITKVSKLNSP